jgi:hypothetical protein
VDYFIGFVVFACVIGVSQGPTDPNWSGTLDLRNELVYETQVALIFLTEVQFAGFRGLLVTISGSKGRIVECIATPIFYRVLRGLLWRVRRGS